MKNQQKKWFLFGQTILVERKRIKNLYLYVKEPDGQILISAPLKMEEREIQAFLEKKWDWIRKKQAAIEEKESSGDAGEKDGEGEAKRRERYRQYLLRSVPSLLETWEPVMGVHALEWRIRDMKTRWGSCNVQARRIWLNLRLGGKPFECLEYVVVHELCHLLEPSHNQVFWSYMSQFLPDWKERRKRLNS